MDPAIENPTKLDLSPEISQTLKKLFAGYRRVILRKEFGNGLSGGRVFEVGPINADGIPELPAVVKLAAISLIQKEWQAYRRHIRHRLPNVTEVTGEPALLPAIGWGGLRYTLLGSSGAFETVSLADYCRRADISAADIGLALERLFRVMHHLWGYSHLEPEFCFQPHYDHLLPVDLLVRQQPVEDRKDDPHLQPLLITPDNLPTRPLQPGDRVQVSGFALKKVNPTTQTMTLSRPPETADKRAYHLRCKMPLVETMMARQINQIVEPFAGEVIETRLSRLRDEMRRVFGPVVEPMAENIPLPMSAGVNLPNPLCALERLLNHTRPVKMASIHGDFNFENILIEPETGVVSLIDFAEVGEAHALRDFLRLESEVMTKLLPSVLNRCEVPLLPTLAYLYWQLHRATFQTVPASIALPHPALTKVWGMLTAIRRAARQYLFDGNDPSEYYHGLILYLLGTLKFKNLNNMPESPLPKQLAFWGATLIYQFLTAPAAEPDAPPPGLIPLIEMKIVQLSPASPTISQPNPPKLDTSAQQLAALPLDSVPNLAPLPPHSRMPLSRNPLFVGREQDLKRLARVLKGGSAIAIGQVETAATTGLGGIGKTQLASEFVHRYGRFFAGGVFWISFADPKAIPAEIAACGGAGALNLSPDFGERSLDDQIKLVQAAWQEPVPRLLIFDNCEEPDLLAQWRPPSGGCRLLVTSRRADWELMLGVQTLPLDVLNRAESIALLRNHYPDADDAILDAIAEELGDLPLALHLAGSYLARYRRTISPAKYLEQLRDPALLQHRSLKGREYSPTGHVQNVYRTIALSYDQLDPTDPVDQ